MKTETVTICGVEYVRPDACTFGDYGGYGSYGLANIRSVIADAGESVAGCTFNGVQNADDSRFYPRYANTDETSIREEVRLGTKVLHATGDFGSETVWLRKDWEQTAEILEALESYPSLDDDKVSQIELDWENEAWESWLKYDLIRAAFPWGEAADDLLRDLVEEAPDGQLFEAYRDACEETNTYPEAEYSGVHVDVDRIKDAFRAAVLKVTVKEAN
jgi:hypothetical protein